MQGDAGGEGPSGAAGLARLVVDGPEARAVPLRQGAVVLGRADECDVVLADTAVSRRHARIERTPRGWVLSDLGSSTGTFLDGSRIGDAVVLRHGARVRVGRVQMRFEDEAAPSPAPVPAPSPAAARAPAAAKGPASPEARPATPARRAANSARVPGVDDPLVGTMLGELRILGRIGVGATGHVYRARQENLGREVAVKVLSPQLASSPQRVDAFLREARAAARLVHPSLVTVFDAGRQGGTPYFVMELMDGGSVEERLAAAPGGRLPWKDAFPMLLACARGLEYLHAQGVLHRDLKPANLLLKQTGEVKIADLGIALEIREARTAAKAGTPHYAAPEVVRGEPATERADLYSLGATFHHVLTGKPPFAGADRNELLRRVAEGHRPRVLHRSADVPSWLGQIVDQLTEGDPKDRVASAAELVEALQETDVRRKARAMGIGAAPPGAAQRAAARSRRSGPVIAGLVGLALLGGVAWALRDRFDGTPPRDGPPTPRAPTPVDGPLPAAAPATTAPSDAPEDPEEPARPRAPGDRAIAQLEGLIADRRHLDAVDVALRWARDPARTQAVDDDAKAAVARVLDWVRTNAPKHREAIHAELLADQSRLASAYGAGVRPAGPAAFRPDFAAITSAKARAAAVEQLAPTLRAEPLRARAEELVAKLTRVHTTWRRFVALLGTDDLVKTWDEIRGVPQLPPGSVAWISRAAPPTHERITFERQAGAGRERIVVKWTDLGVADAARTLVVPFVSRADARFRVELAEMFEEAGAPDAAAACLADLPDGPAKRRVETEIAALRAFAQTPEDPARVEAWGRAHRRSDAFLRLVPEPPGPRELSLDDARVADLFDPK